MPVGIKSKSARRINNAIKTQLELSNYSRMVAYKDPDSTLDFLLGAKLLFLKGNCCFVNVLNAEKQSESRRSWILVICRR